MVGGQVKCWFLDLSKVDVAPNEVGRLFLQSRES